MSGGLRNKSASKLEKVEVASTSSFGADVDPRAIDLAMRIAERMFLKMKEDEAKNKIEEENDRWRPNDESTSSQGSSFKSTSHMCFIANGSDSESESEDEEERESDSEDEDDLQQFFAQLSKKHRMSLLKLMKRAEEQKEMLHKQEDFLIRKIEDLEKLTKEHEKLKCSHDDLVQRYEDISIEQIKVVNHSSYIAQLENKNAMFKNTIERLNIENLALQEKHDMLVCSHNKFMDSHIMLEMAHEVVLTNLKSYQPHICTCTQVETILSCANKCCSQESQSSIELEISGISDISITQENKELKEEVGMLRRSLTRLKGKCHAQPSQDNRDNMVKKLEKGTTVACTKPLQKKTKLSKKGMRKIHGEKINAHMICSNNVPMCFNKERLKRSDRRCYGCKEKGHEIDSCPHMKNQDLARSRKMTIKKDESKRQMHCKDKHHICYNCREKGHLFKVCPKGKTPKPNLSIHSNMLRRPKFDSCARKVMSSPHSRTKAIWVPKSLLANLDGPIMRWVPKCT